MSYFLELYTPSVNKLKFELDLPNPAATSNLKNVTGVDISNFAMNSDIDSLKLDVDEIDIDKLKNVPSVLDNLKSKVNRFRFIS